MNFGKALELLKEGKRVTRGGWNGKGMWLELQRPTVVSKMTLPYIFMKTANDDLVPWLASQTDILSEDWGVKDKLFVGGKEVVKIDRQSYGDVYHFEDGTDFYIPIGD